MEIGEIVERFDAVVVGAGVTGPPRRARRHHRITDEEQARIKSSFDEIFRRTRESFAGFVQDFEPGSALDRTPEEREALYRKRRNEPGFAKWLGLYFDIFTDETANASIAEFARVSSGRSATRSPPRATRDSCSAEG